MDSQEELQTKQATGIVLIILFLFELFGLLPWYLISIGSAMTFDSGVNWRFVLMMLPFWLYPILLLVCGIVSYFLNKKGKNSGAIITILMPPLISFGCLSLLFSYVF